MEVTSFCLFLLSGCICRSVLILQSWFWLVAIISSWGRANRAVMLWCFGAKKGQNKGSGSKSRARITSCSSGPADAGRLTPALCKTKIRKGRVIPDSLAFDFVYFV